MKKQYFLIGLMAGISFLPVKMAAQCPNLNFSMGSLANWQCYSGSSGNEAVPVAPISGKHTIMNAITLLNSGQFMDENCNKIPKVPDGYLYSCRIGNVGYAGTNAIAYEMTVDSNNSLLVVSFAWVMNKAGHLPNDQPQITLKITDSTGNVLPFPCGEVNIVSENSISELVCETGGLAARTWNTVGFGLEPFIGQTIKVYFETKDCVSGSHFAYAYVVAECRPMRIDVTYCEGMSVAHLRAPEGFFYTWTRSSQPGWKAYSIVINITDPIEGEEFTCTLMSELGCETELKTTIRTTQIEAMFYHGVRDEYGYVPLIENNWISWYDTCSRTATFVERVSVYNSKKSFYRVGNTAIT